MKMSAAELVPGGDEGEEGDCDGRRRRQRQEVSVTAERRAP